MRLLSELANYQVRFLWVGDTSHAFTAGVWNIRNVKDGEDVKPSLALQVKKFSKGQGKTFFFPFGLIWIFTHIEKCQGHHTRETIAIHHFTPNRLRLHRRVNAEWPPNSSCSSSAVRHLKFSRLSFFKSLSLVGGGKNITREAETLIHHATMSAKRSTRCRRHVPTSCRGAFKARRVQLGELWIADWTCLSLLTACKRRGKKKLPNALSGCDVWKFRGGFEQPNGMFAERINRWVSRLLFCLNTHEHAVWGNGG